MYEGFTKAGLPPVHKALSPLENQEDAISKSATTETSLINYIPIQSITRVGAGQNKKTKKETQE